jgi:uncharacterized protein (TIGR02453 family)
MAFEKTSAFLKALKKNNNKEWFDKNKSKYLDAKEEFDVFVQSLITGLSKMDKKISPDLKAKDCVFRIYKDVRFSKDKTPYKTHFGAYFSPGGKKSSAAGYYVHFQPGGLFIAGGNWQPEPLQLQAIRQEIDYNGDKLVKILKSKPFSTYFKGLSDDDKLKTVPKGFDKEHKQIELLKLKSFVAVHEITDSKLKGNAFEKEVMAGFKAMLPLLEFLREASDN